MGQFPFQIYLLEQARPSPVTVQPGGTQRGNSFPCCSSRQCQCHHISAEQRGELSACSSLPQILPPKRENHWETPGDSNQWYFRGQDSSQRGGCSQYSYFSKRNGPALPAREVERTVPSHAGQQGQCSELPLSFAPKRRAPLWEELPGPALALGSPAKLLQTYKAEDWTIHGKRHLPTQSNI